MSKGVQSVGKNLPPKPPVPKKPVGLELRAPRKPLIRVKPAMKIETTVQNGKPNSPSPSEDENSSSTSLSSLSVMASSTPKVKDMIIKFEKSPPKSLCGTSPCPSLFDPGSSRNSITSLDLPDMSECPPSPDSFTSNELTESESKEPETQTDKINNRRKVAFNTAKELLKTERDYVDVLSLIVNDFRDFILSRKSDIPQSSLNNILDPLPQILQLNKQLLSNFEERIENWDQNPKIADVLTKNGWFLKIYSTYIQNYYDKMILLDEYCSKYPGFAKLLEEFEASTRCRKITLKNHMLNPVQRLPRYEMLLTQYLRNLDESSPDLKDAGEALEVMKSVTTHANSSVHHSVLFKENFSKLYQIQTSFAGSYEVIKPGRTFIKEGELYKLCRKETQPRYFILFSDSLLHADYFSPTMKGTLRLRREFHLRDIRVEGCSTDPLQFRIISNVKSFAVKAKNETECKEWVDTMLSAIEISKSKQSSLLTNSLSAEALAGELGRVAPVWIQDKDTTMCPLCTELFTAYFRRHHCRSCGKVVCKLCSNNKAPLEYLKFEADRVCTSCHDYLLEEFLDPSKDLRQRIKVALNLDSEVVSEYYESIKLLFKKEAPKKKSKKSVPPRLLEVTAYDSDAQMCGWLDAKTKKAWKKYWFVLKDKVLYWFHAPHDVLAIKTTAVLGYTINRQSQNISEDMDVERIFRLSQSGEMYLFAAPDKASTGLWLSALEEAVSLSR